MRNNQGHPCWCRNEAWAIPTAVGSPVLGMYILVQVTGKGRSVGVVCTLQRGVYCGTSLSGFEDENLGTSTFNSFAIALSSTR